MNNRFRFDFLILAVFCVIGAAILHSCKTEPSDLGLNFIDPNDTTGTFILDSQADTMTITASTYRNPINPFGGDYMMIGMYQGYEAKSFIKYNGISADYDSANVVSSIIYLKYRNFAFQDSNASISFNVYRVNRDLNYRTVTWDSIMASDIGTTVLGTYTGIPVDSATIAVTLNNQLIKDWLEYAADTVNYPVKNYGIALIPNASSGAIKGFSSSKVPDEDPYVQTIVTKNGETDTLVFNASISLWLANAPASIIPADRFVMQNGIAYNTLMGFDLSKLPSNVIINEALVILTLDTLSSYMTSDRRLRIGFTSDSVRKTDTIIEPVLSLTPVNGVYEIRLNAFFQYWNSGTYPNFGIVMGNLGQFSNFDKYVFYSPAYSDLTKVPRLRIRYTPRLP